MRQSTRSIPNLDPALCTRIVMRLLYFIMELICIRFSISPFSHLSNWEIISPVAGKLSSIFREILLTMMVLPCSKVAYSLTYRLITIQCATIQICHQAHNLHHSSTKVSLCHCNGSVGLLVWLTLTYMEICKMATVK